MNKSAAQAFPFFLAVVILTLFSACSKDPQELTASGRVYIQKSPLLMGVLEFAEAEFLSRESVKSFELSTETPPDSQHPDLRLWTGGQQDFKLLSEGGLVDLTGLFSRYNQTNTPPPINTLRNLYQPHNAQDQLIPIGGYTWGVLYKKSVFDALNLTEPKNLEEFISQLRDLSQRNPMEGPENSPLSELAYPVALGSEFGWPAMAWLCYLDLRLNGPQAHEDLIFGQRSLTDPDAISALEILLSLAQDGVFDPDAQGKNWPQALAELEEGRAVFMLLGGFAWDRTRTDTIGWFPFPSVDTSADTPSGSNQLAELGQILSLGISKESQNTESAFLLAASYAEAGSPGIAGSTFRSSPNPAANTNPAAKLSAEILRANTRVLPSPDRWVTEKFIQRGFPLLRQALVNPETIRAKELAMQLAGYLEFESDSKSGSEGAQ